MNATFQPFEVVFAKIAEIILMLILLLIAGCGCSDSSTSATSGRPSDAVAAGQLQDELFDYAINNLNRLEEFNSGQMPRQIVKQIEEQARIQQSPPQRRGDALLATWPEPEMLLQIINRLNQWVRSQKPPPDWKLDPMVATLPEPLKELSLVRDLGKLEFVRYDGFALREVVWLRDVSDWARGNELDDVDRAKRLFDWTVRNIQLEGDPADPGGESAGWIPQVPWETLYFGRGTAMERAWVFVLLARQQGLDAAVLALGESPSETPPTPWVVAILSQGELYLFDPALGLPIPAPDGIKLGGDGQLDIHPATLAQVVGDDALLRRLDVDPSRPYPVNSGNLKRIVALVEASPTYLACRMGLIQSRLAGQQRMVLSAAPTAEVERLKACAHVTDAQLWTLPYETLLRRSRLGPERIRQRLIALLPFYAVPSAPLRKGRMLYLGGKFTGPQGATAEFQKARPSNQGLLQAERQLAAVHYDMTLPLIEKLPAEQRQRAQQQARQQAAERARLETAFLVRAKQNASYWLGLIASERANYPSAIDYFFQRTLIASLGGPWTHGAKYNLARAYEASNEREKAVELYRSDTTSPAYHGNLLRARWLQSIKNAPSKPDFPQVVFSAKTMAVGNWAAGAKKRLKIR